MHASGVTLQNNRFSAEDQSAMPSSTEPVVYISYRWIDTFDAGRRGRAPDPRGRELADRLRARGHDVRLDLYFHGSLHGFRPPQLDEAIRVGSSVPALWWDWYAMDQEIAARPQKFIPIGYGPYHSDVVPGFVRGASYIDISNDDGLDTLVRRIRQVWRERQPRQGVFISYAHKDDQDFLDLLLSHLSWLRRRGVDLWDDRQIEPGAKWRESIQRALDRAQVGVLLVSPAF